MKKSKYLWLSILSMFFIVIACNNDSDENTEQEVIFNIESQLEYIFDNGIEPQIELVKESAESFKLLIELYRESPTESNFEDLKDNWKELTLAWKPLEVITIGDFALTSKVVAMHFWPFDVELLTTNIESYTEESFELAATAKGLGALEYILFSKDYQTFVENESHTNASAYLSVLIDDVILVIDSYEKEWLDYEEEFKTSTETGVTGTQNQLLNEVVFTFFNIIVDKIQGTIISNSTGTNPLNSETPYSELSLEIIKTQIEFVNELFSGNFNGQEVAVGVYDQLTNVNRGDLVESLQNQFEKTISNISLANASLENLVIEESEVLNQIEDDIIELHTLINNDVFSALGVVTTVGDNDGD